MGSATGRDLHVDQLMSQMAINFRPEGMIWDQIAPIVSVAKESDSYVKFNRGEVFAIENTRRTRGAQANRVTRSVSSEQYIVQNYALAMDIPVEDRANMDPAFAFEFDQGVVRYLNTKLQLDADRRTLLTAFQGVSTTFLCGSAWNAAGTTAGDPLSQVVRAAEQVKSVTAQRPNGAIFGWRAWQFARRNQNFRNLILGLNNGGGLVQRDAARNVFEFERFNVAESFYNPANEAQAATFSTTFPDDAVLIYYAPMAPSRELPSYMYAFRWTDPALGTPFAAIRHEFDSRAGADGIELRYYQAEKVTGSEYGVLIAGVGSAQATGLT